MLNNQFVRNILMAVTLLSTVCLSVSKASGGKESGGIPNPSASNCSKLKGAYVSVSSSLGQEGFCLFGRGYVEAWTLFDVTVGKTSTQATDAFLKHAPEVVSVSGNPASIYCGKVGGQTVILTDQKKNEFGVCRFLDKSEIEEWTLFNGPVANPKLTKILTGK